MEDMEDREGETAFAEYFGFRITSENYTLHNGHSFSTRDRDDDHYIEDGMNCAESSEGAWWYNFCHNYVQSQWSLYFCRMSNLNGRYYHHPIVEFNHGIQWKSWKGNCYSLKKCSMKIREFS